MASLNYLIRILPFSLKNNSKSLWSYSSKLNRYQKNTAQVLYLTRRYKVRIWQNNQEVEYWDFKFEILMVNMKADPKTDKKYRPPWRQALKSWGSQERTNYLPLVVLRSDNNLTFDTFHVTNIRRGLSLSFHADSVVQIFQLHSSLSSCWVYSNLGTYTDGAWTDLL